MIKTCTHHTSRVYNTWSTAKWQNHLTPAEISKAFLQKISHLLQEGQLHRIKVSFQDIFKGINKHKYCQIQLIIDDNVKPIIQPQRKIRFAKREKLNKILDELEESGVIKQVEGPTIWLLNLVLTPKVNPMQIRMKINMTTANTTIRRARHVIPTLEELRYELNGAQYFTKLDMKHGYMQMELDKALRLITTFYMHRGLRQSCRLTFGINAAAEVFHEEIHQTLADIPSVRDMYDDILIYGKTERKHNLALIRVLQRLQDFGLTLNLQKCIFSIPQIEF